MPSMDINDAVQNTSIGWTDSAPETMASVLCVYAVRRPDQLAYLFLGDGEVESARLTFAELDLWARSVAVQVGDLAAIGDRALLLYPPGLEFVKAFFGCLYAGVIPVPAHPWSRHHVHRLISIVENAAPSLVMTTADLEDQLSSETRSSWKSGRLHWIATDTLNVAAAAKWTAPNINSNSLALLQYTSGSTGRPKGVMVSHGNLLANEEAMRVAFGHDEASTLVGWLPVQHDMGLIGNLLQPLYVGATAILMPPMAFLERPARWLRAISKHRARTSGGPNFAYELCLQKTGVAERRELDLSSWTLGFNGSEPVRASTLERFSSTYAEHGFRREAFQPCYGLAEATLLVSTPFRGRAPMVRAFDKEAMSNGVAVADAQLDEAGEGLVSCGSAPSGHSIRIVDPKDDLPCPDGKVGEVWFRGPSSTEGYWRQEIETDQVFHAGIAASNEESFVRTGDLGFIVEGELFIAGRIKDLIILRGRNYYPADLEQVLDERAPGLRPGCNAAFLAPSSEPEADDHLVLVAEVRRDHLRAHGEAAMFQAIRAAVAEASDIGVGEIVLAPPGAVPKTTSGKVRRKACREAYLDGSLAILARSGQKPSRSGLSDASRGSEQAAASVEIERHLRRYVANILRCSDAELPPAAAIQGLGLNSLQVVELKHAVDAQLGVDLPLALLFSDRSLSRLAAEIATLPTGAGSNPLADAPKLALSYAQQAMWTVHQLESESVSNNLHLALDIDGPIDVARLQVALAILMERHEQLRTLYRSSQGEGRQLAPPLEALPEWFAQIDAEGWDIDKLQADLARRAAQPFHVESAPPLRVVYYRRGADRSTLFFGAHHIAVDLWSLLVLLKQLDAGYRALETGRLPKLPEGPSYADFVCRQTRYLAGPLAERDWTYWRGQLEGPLPHLELPNDFPRPAFRRYDGASELLRLDGALTAQLKSLANREGLSLFSLLLAAYFTLLHKLRSARGDRCA
jgi:acyl-CoA synthetase (AMP-forming)/AMP-acid ligase II